MSMQSNPSLYTPLAEHQLPPPPGSTNSPPPPSVDSKQQQQQPPKATDGYCSALLRSWSLCCSRETAVDCHVEFRPFALFFHPSNFKFPSSRAEALQRMHANLTFFFSNYALVCTLITLCMALFNPLLLIFLAVLIVVNLVGRPTGKWKFFLLAVVFLTVLIVGWTGGSGAVMILTFFGVLLHAAWHNFPPTIGADASPAAAAAAAAGSSAPASVASDSQSAPLYPQQLQLQHDSLQSIHVEGQQQQQVFEHTDGRLEVRLGASSPSYPILSATAATATIAAPPTGQQPLPTVAYSLPLSPGSGSYTAPTVTLPVYPHVAQSATSATSGGTSASL